MLSRLLVLGTIATWGGFGCAHAGDPRLSPDADNHHDAPHELGDGPPMHDGPVMHDAPSGGPCSASGVLATWSFAGQSGSEASVPVSSTAQGVTAGDVTRAAALSSASGATSINASNWPQTGSVDSTKYFSFTITPPNGCTMDLTALGADVKSSGTGPSAAVVATDDDNFTATQPVSTTAPSSPTLSVSGAAGTVTIHISGYSATSTSGTMRVENTLTITGALH